MHVQAASTDPRISDAHGVQGDLGKSPIFSKCQDDPPLPLGSRLRILDNCDPNPLKEFGTPAACEVELAVF